MRSKPPTQPPGARPPGTRPTGDRPNTGRPYPDRPQTPRPSGDRPAAPRDGRDAKPPGRAGFTPRQATPAPSARDDARPKPTARDRNSGPRPSRPPERSEQRGPRSSAPARVLGQPAPAPAPAPAPLPEPRPILRAPEQPAAPAPARPSGRGEAPRGSVWLHGTHAVAAALANPNRRLKRLLLTEEAEAALLERTPQPWPLVPERTQRAKLDTLLGRDTVHQGVALLADLLSPPPLATVLERPGPVLVLDQVTDPRNVGAVLRSAAAFGVAAVFMQERNSPDETGVLAKAASGALETVPLLRAVNLARTLAVLKAAGFWVVGLDAGGATLRGGPLRERRVALVLGAEGSGLRRLTRETCDELAGLAMPGGMESLNVSAAATVALYELVRE